MMSDKKQTVVIVGSASLPEKIAAWKKRWEQDGYDVINYPIPVAQETFLQEYPRVHTNFFRSLIEANVVFVMNEDRKGIEGYLGAESFAELGFCVVQNLLNHSHQRDIVLFKRVDECVQSYEEIELWLKLGWIRLYEQ